MAELAEISEIVKDLKELRDKLKFIETLEILADEKLMKSIEKAKSQPKKRKFDEFVEELRVDTLSVSNR